ncbi:MAG: alpha/beta hydrolase [Bacteroidota bacterium]
MRLFNLLLACLITCPALGQGDFFTLTDGTKLYIEETGEGQTLVFIPGWTMTSRFFDKQQKYFSEEYQVVTYDPRGQGRSDKSTYNNTYAYHAADLRELLLQKDLKSIVLIGWSSGCLTMYEYLRSFGVDRIEKLVFIDESPKWIGNSETEWVYGSFDDYRSSLKELVNGQPSDTDGIIDWMLADPVDSLTRQWMREEISMTPHYVALPLYIDGLASDYTQEITKLSAKVSTLFLVRSSWYDQAASWLRKNAPHAEVVSISSHAMFWEQPIRFNQILSKFLTSTTHQR